MFDNQTIELESVPAYQAVELTTLHPNYKKIVAFNAFFWFVGGVFLSLFLLFIDDEKTVYTYFFIPALIGTCIASYNLLAFKKRKYAFRKHDVIYQSGLLATTTNIIPYLRLQHLVVRQGVMAKRLGLATLKLHTAANDNVDVTIPGLTLEEANRWKQFLMNRMEELEDETTH